MALGVRYLGSGWDYPTVWHAMQSFTDNRNENSQDEIWLLQHEAVFTQGQAGKPEHLLNAGNIPVVQSDRGGQVTYHGPGQWVAYILVDIKRLEIGPRQLVENIEQSIVRLLQDFGIESYPKVDAPGVYVNEAKIASLGLRIRKGKSYHGLALNVDMDLEPFQRINPCGYAGLAMTSMAQLLLSTDITDIGHKLIDKLQAGLSYPDKLDLGDRLP